MLLETTEQRSKIMSRIKGKDTKIEIMLRKALWHKGIRYRKNYRIQDCRVDIAITKYKIAVFCDGDFWHGKDFQEGSIKKNTKFWEQKIKRNQERDLDNTIALRDAGWTVLRFWESEIQRNLEELTSIVLTEVNKHISTLSYYRINANAFASGTVSVDFTTTQNRFLKYLKPGAAILDFGCGSGRDAKYFAELGYKVTATDGCAELVVLASEYSGLPVKQLLFSDLAEVEAYDGIWTCASILHLPKAELVDVLQKITVALKPGGYLYTSFKYGAFEGERHGRYFTDMTEASFGELLKLVPGLMVVEEWVSGDVREGRGDERWLNLILRKE